jgi:hypothetical protein
MSEYLVRWKFGPNSLLNKLDHETHWYQQFHSNKEDAVSHYTSQLSAGTWVDAMTVEIFQLVQLVPGQPEPEDVIDKVLKQIPPKKDRLALSNNMQKLLGIIRYHPGICRVDLQKKSKILDPSYNNTMTSLRRRGLIENQGTRRNPEYHVV